jgi:hypothetical protein
MQQQATEPDLPLPYHEVFQTFEIYIDHNSDRWRGGYVWVVSKNNQEVSSGLSFSTGASVEEAWDAVLLMVG